MGLVFELSLSVGMVLREPVGSKLEYLLACCLDWHLAVTLENDKNIWLEFHLAHCMS